MEKTGKKSDLKMLKDFIENRKIKQKTDLLISANELYQETQEVFQNALFSLNYINKKLDELKNVEDNENAILARERLQVVKALIRNNLQHLQDSLDEVPKILVEFNLIDD